MRRAVAGGAGGGEAACSSNNAADERGGAAAGGGGGADPDPHQGPRGWQVSVGASAECQWAEDGCITMMLGRTCSQPASPAAAARRSQARRGAHPTHAERTPGCTRGTGCPRGRGPAHGCLPARVRGQRSLGGKPRDSVHGQRQTNNKTNSLSLSIGPKGGNLQDASSWRLRRAGRLTRHRGRRWTRHRGASKADESQPQPHAGTREGLRPAPASAR